MHAEHKSNTFVDDRKTSTSRIMFKNYIQLYE